MEKDGRSRAWDVAAKALTLLGVTLTFLVTAGIVLSSALRPLFGGQVAASTFSLLPWLLPYAVMICLTGGLAGMLNTSGRFAVPAFTPVLLNVCLIAAALVLVPRLGDDPRTTIFALVPAVLCAGVLQLALHVWACRRSGMRVRWSWDPACSEVRRIGMLMLPGLLGTGIVQVNVAVDRGLAGFLGSGATTGLYFSQRLVYLPVGLFGVAMGVVCLPAMARACARKNETDLLRGLHFALRQVLFLTLPATAVMAATARPVIELLFEGAAFDAESTATTLWALAFYLPGIPAFVVAKVAVTPFHARQDTRTPVRIAAVCMVLNIVLNLVLMQSLAHGGLALATVLCSYLNCLLLFRVLHRELGGLGLRSLVIPLARLVFASALAGGLAFLGVRLLAGVPGSVGELLRVLLPVAAAGGVYWGLCSLLGCEEVRAFFGALSPGRNPRVGGKGSEIC
jgi:putative peptidoglycan lipid II flippase